MNIKITSGKYAGRFISDVCKDRRYMNWIMTNWDHSSTIPKAIKIYIEEQKTLIKSKYTSTTHTDFVKEWLATSYEGYKILIEDIEWVQKILNTSLKDITVGFLRNEYVFKVGEEEFALKPMIVNERNDVFAAFRNGIQEQITIFRRNAFHNKKEHICPETGIVLKNEITTHTDHHFRKKTFNQLVNEFLIKEEVDFKVITIENGGMFYRLKDRSLAERWNEYHKEHAILRLIHVSANTNAEFYLSKYKEAPFELKEKKKKVEKIADPIIMTFDMLPKPL
jgi:hypothetical protein